jgi:hypothetical protein
MRQGSTSNVGPSSAGTPDAGAGPSAPAGPSGAGPSGAGPSAPANPLGQPARTRRRQRIPQGTSIHRRPKEMRMSSVYKRQPKVSHLLFFFFCYPTWAG